MAYDVRIERTAECPTAVVKSDTTWRQFPALWPALLDDVWAFLATRPDLRADGHNVMLYRNNVPEAEVAVEVGVLRAAPRADRSLVGGLRRSGPENRPLRHHGVLAARLIC